MPIYVYSYFFIIIFSIYFHNNKNNILEKVLWLNFTIYLVFLIGFRHKIGGDWWVYEQNYNLIDKKKSFLEIVNKYKFKSELGFLIISLIVKKINLSFHYVNFILSIIFFINLSIFINKFKNKFLCLLICFPIIILIFHAGFIRQSIAFSFFLLSLNSFLKKRNISFILYIFLGFVFHSSIIIFLFLLLFIDRKLNIAKIFLTLFLLTLIFFLFFENFLNLYSIYINQSDNYMLFEYPKGAIYRIGLNLVAAIFFILFYNFLNFNEQELKLYGILSLLVFISFPFLYFFPIVIDRYNFYLNVLQIVIFVRFIEKLDSNKLLTYISFIMLIVIYYTIFFTWSSFGTHSRFWENYNNYLFL